MITEYTNTTPIETVIYSLLSAHTALADMVENNISPDVEDNQGATDYVVYYVINTIKDAAVKQQISRVDRSRIQVDCYAATRARASTIALLARAALENKIGPTAGLSHERIEFDNYNGTFEEDNQRYKASQDFFIRVHND